jgi:hypothetical protein
MTIRQAQPFYALFRPVRDAPCRNVRGTNRTGEASGRQRNTLGTCCGLINSVKGDGSRHAASKIATAKLRSNCVQSGSRPPQPALKKGGRPREI